MANIFALTQRAYRFFNDDGSETTATVAAAQDTGISISVNASATPRIVLRIGLAETGAGSISGATTDDYQLQYSKNAGAYTNVTTSSSNVKAFASSNLTDAGTTTDNSGLTNPGSGSFVAGEISEVGLITDRQITANNFTEFLYTLELVANDVANTDTLDFRVLLNGATTNMTYSVTPRITVTDDGSRYWVGGTDNWNGTAGSKWAKGSGGTGGASEPTSTTNVFLDANSGAVTVTVATSNRDCADLTCTGFTGTLAGSVQILIYGSLVLSSGMGYTHSSVLAFSATSSKTITTNGKVISSVVTINGSGGTFTLQDDLVTTGTFSLVTGTFDANNKNVTCGRSTISGSSTRTLTMGTGLWNMTSGASSNAWDATTTTNLTFNADSSTIRLTGSVNTGFVGGGLTYNNFENDQSGASIRVDFTGSSTFNVFDLAKTNNGRTTRFTAGTTTTVASLITTAGTGHTLSSSTAANHTLSDSSGANSISNTTVSRSDAGGGATWEALTSNGNVDGGNNSGWVFSNDVPRRITPVNVSQAVMRAANW